MHGYIENLTGQQVDSIKRQYAKYFDLSGVEKITISWPGSIPDAVVVRDIRFTRVAWLTTDRLAIRKNESGQLVITNPNGR